MSLENPSANNKEYDFLNGTIKANQDMPFLGVQKGDVLQPLFDGQYFRVGPLSWDKQQLTNEINKGIWTFEATS